jgi:error-prone DNA polymerase
MSATYVPLWCKSHFSFLEGASSPEELVEQAHALGIKALALTDRDGFFGAVRAAVAARKVGLKLIYGTEVSLDDGSCIVMLAQNRLGYGNLCRLISVARADKAKGKGRASWGQVMAHAEGCIGLLGGARSRFAALDPPSPVWVDAMQQAFAGRLYAVLCENNTEEDGARQVRTAERAACYDLPLVAAQEVLYHHRFRRPLQDVLTAVRCGVSLAEGGTSLRCNDEHGLEDSASFYRRFARYDSAAAATLAVAARCTFDLFQLRYRYPSEHLPNGLTSGEWLRRLVVAGAQRRYRGSPPAAVCAQLDHELALIEDLQVTGYFLTMVEIVRFCADQKILCQGRGSAANSAVCFCLGITAVDPVRMGLLFERFLSKERNEPPDIDLDIAHERREEVIQYVYQKYGRRYAAMVSVNIHYRPKSALRDVGKALGIDSNVLNRLSRCIGRGPPEIAAENLTAVGLDPDHPRQRQLVHLVAQLVGVPRHTSIHPGGFLLGHEPVDTLVPVEPGAMRGRTVIQWDKNDVEDLGLFKLDLLGLGMLSQISKCLGMVARYGGKALTLATLPPGDSRTYAMLQRGESVGVFQIESRAQMAMLPRLRPRRFYDLVVQVAIIRPGPIRGDMVHPYLRRRAGEEAVVYPHPDLEPVLARTLGVPLFQEQVMRIAMVAADYTPGEADQLRRDMAAWQQAGRIERHRERLVSRMVAKGVNPEFAERIYAQIEGFGAYGFPESHAASFALLSYASAYLKCHFAAHFYAALLNAQPMGFYSVATLVYQAQRDGVTVLPVCVRRSGWDTELVADQCSRDGWAMRVGLRTMKGFGAGQRVALGRAREAETLDEFARQCRLDRGRLSALAEAGALEAFGKTRREAIWRLRDPTHARREPLFLADPAGSPEALRSSLPTHKKIALDQRQSRHSTRGHPVKELRNTLSKRGFISSLGLRDVADGKRVRCAGLVICRQRPGTAKGVTFITLEDEHGFVNGILWRPVFERFEQVIKGAGFLAVSGRLQQRDGVCHVLVHRAWAPRLPYGLEPPQRRDFR